MFGEKIIKPVKNKPTKKLKRILFKFFSNIYNFFFIKLVKINNIRKLIKKISRNIFKFSLIILQKIGKEILNFSHFFNSLFSFLVFSKPEYLSKTK